MSDITPKDLKEATKAVIDAIKQVARSIKDPRISLAIVGGTALALHLAAAQKPVRSTKVSNFIVLMQIPAADDPFHRMLTSG